MEFEHIIVDSIIDMQSEDKWVLVQKLDCLSVRLVEACVLSAAENDSYGQESCTRKCL